MRLPKAILKELQHSPCLERVYPKNRPNNEQVTVCLDAVGITGKPCGFLVVRTLHRRTGPENSVLENHFHENFYETKELLRALADYQEDVLPETGTEPFKKFEPRTNQVPKLQLERKTLLSDPESRLHRAEKSGKPITINDIA